jgi:putative hemolysin
MPHPMHSFIHLQGFAVVFPFPSTLLLAGVCLAISFLYSGIEGGLLSIDRVRLRSRVHQEEPAAIRLNRLLSHPERLMATVLLVTNFADVAALILLTDGFVREFGGWGYVWAGVALLPVYLLGVQLLPKALFRRFPYRALAALAGVLEKTSKVFSPLLAIGRWMGRCWFVSPAPKSGKDDEKPLRRLFVAREEFKILAAEGERTGALTGAERGMIHNVVDFSNLSARDAMIPPPEAWRVESAGKEPGVNDLLTFAKARQLEHLPVIGANGELLALVDVFALLLERDRQRSAAPYLRRPLVVVPDEPAHRVLRRLRAARLPAAAVVEANRLVGVIRTRDLLQRLVRGVTA